MNPFKGELSRPGYLLWTLLAWVFIFANAAVIDSTKNTHKGNYWLGYRIIVILIFLGLYLLATYRRLQNTKYHPRWSVLVLVPYFDALVWLALLFIPPKRSRT